MLKKDNYLPPKDKDGFIQKNIISILEIISRIKMDKNNRINKFNINAVTKLIAIFVMIVFVALTKKFTFVIISNVVLLVLINLLSTDNLKYVLKTVLGIGIFTTIILLPSLLFGYGNNILMILLKVVFSAAMANILACTTKWQELVRAVKAFHIPDMFIFVLDITIKYIVILSDLSLNMVYALKIKSVGRNKSKNTALTGILGTMFIKSKEFSEDMYSAMECRGFDGSYNICEKFKFRLMDYMCLFFVIIFILIYFYFDRL